MEYPRPWFHCFGFTLLGLRDMSGHTHFSTRPLHFNGYRSGLSRKGEKAACWTPRLKNHQSHWLQGVWSHKGTHWPTFTRSSPIFRPSQYLPLLPRYSLTLYSIGIKRLSPYHTFSPLYCTEVWNTKSTGNIYQFCMSGQIQISCPQKGIALETVTSNYPVGVHSIEHRWPSAEGGGHLNGTSQDLHSLLMAQTLPQGLR